MDETRAANEATEAPATPAAGAGDVANLVRAWSALFESELAVARQSLGSLLIGAILVPAAALSAWLGLNALFVVAAQVYTGSLALALLLTFGAQLLALALLLHWLRRWARDLTLPHSRGALARIVEKTS